MHKYYLKNVPQLFYNFFTLVENVHCYRTRQSNNLYCPKVRTNLGMTGISYRGPLIWNKILDMEINLNTSDISFSKEIRKLIIAGKL